LTEPVASRTQVRSVVIISKRRDEAVWPRIATSVRFEVKVVPEEGSAKKAETVEVYRVNGDGPQQSA
jgi:hypothetical protein